ncbi:unannotated protein [freshwater metagenome]|uniref:Unannotated protein n=1 Tax=freshwater metagenome TaxID=449393 RepID=A0A6J7DTK3_9ZZZZ
MVPGCPGLRTPAVEDPIDTERCVVRPFDKSGSDVAHPRIVEIRLDDVNAVVEPLAGDIDGRRVNNHCHGLILHDCVRDRCPRATRLGNFHFRFTEAVSSRRPCHPRPLVAFPLSWPARHHDSPLRLSTSSRRMSMVVRGLTMAKRRTGSPLYFEGKQAALPASHSSSLHAV